MHAQSPGCWRSGIGHEPPSPKTGRPAARAVLQGTRGLSSRCAANEFGAAQQLPGNVQARKAWFNIGLEPGAVNIAADGF
ncbi:unnamed protein product [Mesocestoides corti]|uniref:Transposase n=1 Tax=Mesocestoides corti TaxID=53468 RepID=A0A0R3U3F3_MESCO|nr:unnamed protein product [Mesocestoides corti]